MSDDGGAVTSTLKKIGPKSNMPIHLVLVWHFWNKNMRAFPELENPRYLYIFHDRSVFCLGQWSRSVMHEQNASLYPGICHTRRKNACNDEMRTKQEYLYLCQGYVSASMALFVCLFASLLKHYQWILMIFLE